jgi:hypothetical protein
MDWGGGLRLQIKISSISSMRRLTLVPSTTPVRPLVFASILGSVVHPTWHLPQEVVRFLVLLIPIIIPIILPAPARPTIRTTEPCDRLQLFITKFTIRVTLFSHKFSPRIFTIGKEFFSRVVVKE